MYAVAALPRCPLLRDPHPAAQRLDEVLLGWTVEVLDASGPFRRVRTDYGYTGWAPAEALALSGAGDWLRRPKLTLRRALQDVLAAPRVPAPTLLTPLRGALLAPLGEPDGAGWRPVLLPDGRQGYLNAPDGPNICSEYPAIPPSQKGRDGPSAVCTAALAYLGVPYRWGGKTPLGIDCSGLTFMAFRLAGYPLFRDAQLRSPAAPIPPEALAPGDLLYYPGHVALYLGEGRYIHATARPGVYAVAVNSLDPADPAFREDLSLPHLAAAGRHRAFGQ